VQEVDHVELVDKSIGHLHEDIGQLRPDRLTHVRHSNRAGLAAGSSRDANPDPTPRRWLIDARTRLQRPPEPPPVPSSGTITGWIMRSADKLGDDATTSLNDACGRCLYLAALTELAHGFSALVRQHHRA